jgi:hypothetical protein
MLYASENANIAFMMFRFDQFARSVARDVAAGWLEHSVDLEEFLCVHALHHRAQVCATLSNDTSAP